MSVAHASGSSERVVKEDTPIRRAIAGFCLLCLLTACGCRSNANARIDVLEAELRARDNQIAILRGELEQARIVNQAIEQELHVTPLPHPPEISGRPLAPLAVGPLKELEIGRGTGGVDRDGILGDESLLVVVVPRDTDGSEIKAAGSLLVSAYEVTPQGLKLPLSTWQLSQLDLRKSWKSGLFSTG